MYFFYFNKHIVFPYFMHLCMYASVHIYTIQCEFMFIGFVHNSVSLSLSLSTSCSLQSNSRILYLFNEYQILSLFDVICLCCVHLPIIVFTSFNIQYSSHIQIYTLQLFSKQLDRFETVFMSVTNYLYDEQKYHNKLTKKCEVNNMRIRDREDELLKFNFLYYIVQIAYANNLKFGLCTHFSEV